MNRLFKIALPALCLLGACSGDTHTAGVTRGDTVSKTSATIPAQKLSDFVPEGYVLFDSVMGDLNKDNVRDYALIIKGTQQSQFVKSDQGEMIDRNRRGLVILFGSANGYHEVLSNKECFSSENEDGGVYFAPELSVEISKGNLVVGYAHGRYGFWSYTFRYQEPDFELIGFDASDNRGPVVETETSINFLTGKKQVKVNTNENAEGEDEVFKETWSSIKSKEKIRLSKVEDFDSLELPR
ncbi:MAG: hypothetical protein QM743_13840 [Chitinophagaceae bacterium]